MNKQIKIGAVIGYINMAVSAVIAIIYIPLLTEGIGNSEYGIYQLMGSLVAYFTTTYTSLNASILKNYVESLKKNESDQQNMLAISRKIFRQISLIVIVVSIPVGAVFYKIYASSLTEHELKESILIFGILILNILIYLNNNIYSAAIQAREKFIFRKCVDLMAQCLHPIAVILFVKAYPYALTMVVIQVCINMIVSISNYWYAKYRLNIVIQYHYQDLSLIKNVVSLSLAVLGVAFADQIFWKVDQLILGKLYGTEIVTPYSIPTQINAMYINLGTIIGGMILPSIVTIVRNGNRQELDKKFLQLGKVQSYILSSVLFGMILYSDELMKMLYRKYSPEMFFVLVLLAVPYTIDLIQNSGNAILQARNLYHLRAKTMLSAAILNVVLTVLMSIQNGMIGAAAATAITIIVTSGVGMNIIYKKFIKLDIKKFWMNIVLVWLKQLPSLIIGFFIKKIETTDLFFTFIVHCLLYMATYIFFLITIGIHSEDKAMLVKKIRDMTN